MDSSASSESSEAKKEGRRSMSHAYTTFFFVVMALQLAGAVWLTRNGRSIGYFFGLVAVAGLVSLL